jgi:hypothetical protein
MVKHDRALNRGGYAKEPLWIWWVVIAIVLLSGAMRYGLIDVPLERDEGEYAYAGQLILQGFLPYQDLYSMKLPSCAVGL